VPLGIAGVLLIRRLVPADFDMRRAPFDLFGFFLSAGAMGALIWGLESAVYGFLPLVPALLLTAVGAGLAAAALRWLRRAPHPLVSLAPFKVPTFSVATLTGSFGFRITAAATPFLIPLLFQFAFGLDPFQAGLHAGAYFLGSLVMKTATTPLLRSFGFRTVMIVNGIACAILLAMCALITPALPMILIVAILIGAGLTRSMQFTAFSTLQFVDVDREQQGAASTISTMLHQIASVFGIVLAAVTLSLSRDARGADELVLADFQIAFLVVAALALVTSFDLFRMSADAGQEASGHRTRRRSVAAG
jgi:MFS family permease